MASELNAAILKMENRESTTPKLSNLLKVILWSQDELDKKRIRFPRLSDLASATITSPKWDLPALSSFFPIPGPGASRAPDGGEPAEAAPELNGLLEDWTQPTFLCHRQMKLEFYNEIKDLYFRI